MMLARFKLLGSGTVLCTSVVSMQDDKHSSKTRHKLTSDMLDKYIFATAVNIGVILSVVTAVCLNGSLLDEGDSGDIRIAAANTPPHFYNI